jgi:RNA polymerase sigma factor (sigma-70 family)
MQDNYRDKRTLLTAIRNSENAAFEHLYSAYYIMVSNYVKKNNGTEDDARDIFQEVVFIFYKKLRGDPNLELNVEIGTYLYAIAHNLWLTNLRKKTIIVNVDNDTFLSDSIEDVNETEQHLEIEKKHNHVADVLKSLKEECRNIIEAAFYKRLSGIEIAKLLGYTESFVKVKKFRCLEELRKKVNGD